MMALSILLERLQRSVSMRLGTYSVVNRILNLNEVNFVISSILIVKYVHLCESLSCLS